MELTSKETDLAKFWEIWVSGASVNLCSLFILTWTLYFQLVVLLFVLLFDATEIRSCKIACPFCKQSVRLCSAFYVNKITQFRVGKKS